MPNNWKIQNKNVIFKLTCWQILVSIIYLKMQNIATINAQNKICSEIILKIDVNTNKYFNTSHDYRSISLSRFKVLCWSKCRQQVPSEVKHVCESLWWNIRKIQRELTVLPAAVAFSF